MSILSLQTVRSKLLFAYLALIALFVGSGLFVLLQLNQLRSTADDFFGHYIETEDLIISSRYLIDEISNTVLAPPANLNVDRYTSETRNQLTRYASDYRQAIIPDEQKHQVAELLLQHSRFFAEPLRLSRIPVEKMLDADKVAAVCLRQAEKIHAAKLVNAIAGIVDSYTDTLVTNDPDERIRFDRQVRLIEEHPSYSEITSFQQLKKAALAVFAASTNYLLARDRFNQSSGKLARLLADIDKEFHNEFLLPIQQGMTVHLRKVTWVIFIVLVGSVLLLSLISVLLAKRIWRPLINMGDMVERLTQGQLNHRLKVDGKDELSVIGFALNRFADQLKSTLEQLDDQMADMAIIESDLRKSEEYSRNLSREYQVVLDGISESLVVINHERNVVWSNRQASEEFFVEIGRRVKEKEGSLDQGSAYYLGFEQVDLCFETGEKSEEVVQGRNGQYFRIKVFPLFDEAGQVSRVLRVTSNITEQYRLREESDRSSRLASLGELAAGVAHEINNPNSLTLLNCPVVKEAIEDIGPMLDEKYRREGDFRWGGLPYSRMKDELPEMVREMHDGARRIQRIVDDLKNFVRKGDAVEVEKIHVNNSVEAGIRLSRNLIRKSTDSFSLELDPNLPGIKGNLVQFEQVVVNLVQNACHALTDRNKGIVVRTFLDKVKGGVGLQVRDEGVGIAPENLKRVTDPFFTTRRKEGGTGLGLSVTKRIIDDHKGTMNIASKPGEGTTVTILFPVNSSKMEKSQ